MKNKTTLMLMELLIMVLVFALAAAICLKVFVRSHELSSETQNRDRAMLAAQNAAETVKACADPEEAARLLTDSGCHVQLISVPSETPGLAGCEITAECEGETFSLTVFWQEVAP